MIAISKEEKEVIVKRLPDVHIVRTMKQKSKRHHYYCEETAKVTKILRQMRGGADDQKVGAEHGNNKTRR